MSDHFGMEQKYSKKNSPMHMDAKVLSNVRKGWHFYTVSCQIYHIERYIIWEDIIYGVYESYYMMF